MTQRTIVQLTDDLDGTEIEPGSGQTIRFGFDGAAYEIDLTNEHADGLRSAVADYIAAGRRVRASAARNSTRPRATASDTDLAAIRAWASEHGYSVSNRGRIAKQVREAYAAAH